VLDARNNTVLNTFPSAGVSNAIAVNVITGLVYVAGAVVATIPITATAGYGIVALAVDPFNDLIFASDASDNTLVVINGRTHRVKESVPLNGQTPAGLGVNFLTGTVYVALNDSEVAIVSPGDDKVTYATYGSQTSDVVVDPFLGREYVTDGVFTSPTVGVLNRKGATVASVPVGLFPQGLDLDFVTNTVFVANEADGTITKIDGRNNTVITTIPVAANSIAVNPRDRTVYAAGSASVTVLTED
jgi:DNA-binding beta-propeller fold protein YncE